MQVVVSRCNEEAASLERQKDQAHGTVRHRGAFGAESLL